MKQEIKGGFDMVASKLDKCTAEYLAQLDGLIEKIKSLPLEEAQKCCKKSLKASGILTTKGKTKKRICGWM